MNPKVINSMNARLARLEALLENSDVFKAEGGVTYGGLQFEGSTYNIGTLDQQMADNYGFDANANTIFELRQRISELELLIAGGSRDTNQSGAQDAGAAVGDDKETGSGSSGGEQQTPEQQAADLGLGTMAYQNSSAVSITGGNASSMTLLSGGAVRVSDGSNNLVDLATVAGATNYGRVRVRNDSSIIVEIDNDSAAGGVISLYDDGGANQSRIEVAAAGLLRVSGSGNGVSITDTTSVELSSAGYIKIGTTTTDTVGFFGSSGIARPDISGSRGGNAALASPLTQLANLGLLTDSTSA